MPRRLPPLNSLTREAAARHLSFARAAEELLSPTPSAISHQIKSLEEQVGTKLFERRGRNVGLTDAGGRYYPALRQAFDRMHEATEELKQSDRFGALTVNVLPTFAIRYCYRSSTSFRSGIRRSKSALPQMSGTSISCKLKADAAVRFGNGDWPGLESRLLMTEEIVPVCSPTLLEKGPGLKSPADLKHYSCCMTSTAQILGGPG